MKTELANCWPSVRRQLADSWPTVSFGNCSSLLPLSVSFLHFLSFLPGLKHVSDTNVYGLTLLTVFPSLSANILQ